MAARLSATNTSTMGNLMPQKEMITTNDLNNWAVKLAQSGRYPMAEAVIRRGLVLDPESALLLGTLGLVLLNGGKYYKATEALMAALEKEPEDWGFHHNIALAYMSLGDFDIAMEHMNKAVDINPTDAAARWDRALILLAGGEWKQGWQEYEARKTWLPQHYPRWMFSTWRGESLNGKSLFVQAEQGAGDTLNFSRYLAWVKERYPTCKIYFAVIHQLAALFRGHPHIHQLILTGEVIPKCDYGVYLCSLPGMFGTTDTHVPPDDGWFKVRASQLNFQVPEASEGSRKVGIVWAGNATHKRDAERSMLLEQFLPLVSRPDLSVYSFQFGQRSGDISLLAADGFIVDLGQAMSDWTVTAGMLAKMDLVIGVDTAVTHLAAGMGIETHILLSYVSDFRWTHEGDSTVWYPSARLYRQPSLGDWNSVMEDVLDVIGPVPEIETNKTISLGDEPITFSQPAVVGDTSEVYGDGHDF